MMMRASAGLAAAIGLMAAAGSAAQDQPSFPSSLERGALLAWLQRETDILPDRVVAVTPQSITSVVSTFPAGGGQGPRVVIRAEALSADTFARTGSLSWHVSLNADCAGRRLRLGETTGYPQRNLLGERRILRDADTEWRVPEAGTALDFAWRAACDPNFEGPFQTRSLKVAQAETPAAPAPPVARPAAEPPSGGPPAKAPAPAVPKPVVAPAPRPAPAAAPPRTGGMVAQVGSSTSEADAKGILAKLGSRTEGRATWVEKAEVDGKTRYRAVVGGFGGAADANRFCADLKAAGRACLVRAGKAG
ncbi:SPOR domain-containing protein [Phenylobacterium sp.]|uniref:SPOR domain-containing protein n=1 Tax=Phenylobacterium sp. TaxID=1871053 RepID=UPI0025F9B906|nr:SPOR domain-containing protein [Phenylobacterium sp.]MBX3482611.1 SPOR domain-containing protein [Phenylobacterium sp.]